MDKTPAFMAHFGRKCCAILVDYLEFLAIVRDSFKIR